MIVGVCAAATRPTGVRIFILAKHWSLLGRPTRSKDAGAGSPETDAYALHRTRGSRRGIDARRSRNGDGRTALRPLENAGIARLLAALRSRPYAVDEVV